MRNSRLYLEDCLEAISRILKYTRNVSADRFFADELVADAVIRNLEVIGEAVRYVPDEVKKANPGIPWESIRAMRNILTHEYFGVSKPIIWKTITLLPGLRRDIKKILKNMPES